MGWKKKNILKFACHSLHLKGLDLVCASPLLKVTALSIISYVLNLYLSTNYTYLSKTVTYNTPFMILFKWGKHLWTGEWTPHCKPLWIKASNTLMNIVSFINSSSLNEVYFSFEHCWSKEILFPCPSEKEWMKLFAMQKDFPKA